MCLCGLGRGFLFQTHAVSIPVHRFLHAQRGIERPLWVILVRDGRAEQRQDDIE